MFLFPLGIRNHLATQTDTWRCHTHTESCLSACFLLHTPAQLSGSLVSCSLCLGQLWIIHQELKYWVLLSLMESGLFSSHLCWGYFAPFYRFTSGQQLPRSFSCSRGLLSGKAISTTMLANGYKGQIWWACICLWSETLYSYCLVQSSKL